MAKNKADRKAYRYNFSFPFGADITGCYVRPDGEKPSLAVLCPECASGMAGAYWLLLAESGQALDVSGWESAVDWAAWCESCGIPAYEWPEL